MCSGGVQQVKGDATHIFVADFVRRREAKERPGTLPRLWVPPLLQRQRTQKVVPIRKRSRLGRPLLSSCLPRIWIKHGPSHDIGLKHHDQTNAVWIVLTAIGLLAAAGAFWSASGTREITLTETELQEQLGRHLPKEFRGVTVDRATVKLADNRIALRIEAQGSALGAPYAVAASANGAPRYDAARGELFFDADSVQIESVTLRGAPLLGGENNPDTLRGRIEAAAHSIVEIGIKTFLAERPVYRFSDNLKGMVLNAAITNIAIAGNTLVIGVSLWNLTAIGLAFLLVVLLALWLIVVLIRHPMWGPGKAVG